MSSLTDKDRQVAGQGFGSAASADGTALPSKISSQREQLKDALLTTTVDGVITGCDLALHRYGYGPEVMVGTNLAQLFCADDQSVFTKLVLPAVREQGRCETTLRARTRRGEEFSFHLCLSLLRDGNSTPTGMAALISEISESKPSSPKGSAPSGTTHNTTRRMIEGTEFLIASPVMHKFMGLVDRVAGHTETVLVVGETGTGKELV
ncbi:MAG: PAS domain S-box protein, partial [Terriglobales bacterium]